MRHPHIDFRLPPRFVALLDWLLQGHDAKSGRTPFEHALQRSGSCLYDIDSLLLAARAGGPLPQRAPHQELIYDNHPIEVVPFSHNGGDSLVYAWALLAPELDLDELPCVSFAPVDPEGAVWLGDDMTTALENMLLGSVADGLDQHHEPAFAALCQAMGLAPDFTRTDITAGARTSRTLHPFRPAVPAGYRFEPMSDGIGVLAPASAFAPGPFDGSAIDGEDTTLAEARRHIDEGHPASALVALTDGYFEDTPAPLVRARREAYLALGRPALAERASAWLAFHTE